MPKTTNVDEMYITLFHQIDDRMPLLGKHNKYLCELINRGLVRYQGRRSCENLEPNDIMYERIMGLTYSGRMELARLEREKYLQSWECKLKYVLWQSLTFVVGALVSAMIGYLFR